MFRPRFVVLALALLTLLLYLPVRQHEFLLYDDPEYITENPMVRAGLTGEGLRWAFATFHANNWHPLTWLSHMLDAELFGMDSGAHHLVNALFHAANAALLFLLLLRLRQPAGVAAVVAALFAWHPLHIQSVAWAAERKDVLSTFFGLMTILAYIRWTTAQSSGREQGPAATLPRPPMATRGYAAVVALFACSLLAKPMLVTMPFLLLLLDYWPLDRWTARPGRLVFEKLPLLLLTLGSSLVTYAAQRAEAVVAFERHPLPARAANAALAYTGYLWKTVWPADLAIIYPLERSPAGWAVALGAVVLVGFSVLAWMNRARRPHLFVGWFWYVGLLVPVIGIIQVGGQSMADRYTYVPLIGIFLAVAVEAARWATGTRLRVLGAGTAVLLVACAAGTWWQLQFWRNTETLFGRALAVTKENAVAHVNYGMALEQSGRAGPARKHYAEAVRINPSLAQAHNNLANLLDQESERERALEHYRSALRLKPRAALTHANMASLLASMGRWDEAREHFAEAARLAPSDPRPRYLEGKALAKAGRNAEALRSFEDALRRGPNDLATLTTLARLLATAEDPGVRDGMRALGLAQRAAELTGYQHPVVLDTLATALATQGQFTKAAEVLRLALDAGQGGDPAVLEEMRGRLRSWEDAARAK